MSAKISYGKYSKTAPAGSQEELSYKSVQGLILKFNALLAKLDADAGVTDTNYKSTLKVVDPDTLLIQSPKKQGT